ncbi:hypothetical protein NUZ5A_20197 [Candidatus Nitrosotenuis uzonensis]|uniref:Uncharacterized protein n=1 Tax=Candidatus Nitrosotenuis uzonensis TaxID=1407055 RepID=A0A812F3Z7_9ARCH|nr:hypothetical protein NUZ5A_20197 [Candidatus Nitrosotenuis uzonensis]
MAFVNSIKNHNITNIIPFFYSKTAIFSKIKKRFLRKISKEL